jgi:hypothetical protein
VGEAMKILLHVPCDDFYALHNLDRPESWIIEAKKKTEVVPQCTQWRMSPNWNNKYAEYPLNFREKTKGAYMSDAICSNHAEMADLMVLRDGNHPRFHQNTKWHYWNWYHA